MKEDDLNPKLKREIDAILAAKSLEKNKKDSSPNSSQSSPIIKMGVKLSVMSETSPGIWQIAPVILLRGTLEDAATFVREIDEMARGDEGTTSISAAFTDFLAEAGMAVPEALKKELETSPSLEEQISYLFSAVADMQTELNSTARPKGPDLENNSKGSVEVEEDLKPLTLNWWAKFISWLLHY